MNFEQNTELMIPCVRKINAISLSKLAEHTINEKNQIQPPPNNKKKEEEPITFSTN